MFSQLENSIIDRDDPNSTIIKMNTLLGNSPILTSNKNWIDVIKNQTFNLKDEYDEFVDAYNNNDRVEMIDAYGDMLTIAYGISFFIGGFPLYGIKLDDSSDDNNDLPFIMEVLYDSCTSILNDINKLYNINIVNDMLYKITNELIDFMHFANNIPEILNFDPSVVLERVTQSNITKICMCEKSRDNTMNHYSDLGIDTYSKEMTYVDEDNDISINYHVVYSSKEQTDINGKIYRKNKFLKCVDSFTVPNLQDL